jgi:hypothetical protein
MDGMSKSVLSALAEQHYVLVPYDKREGITLAEAAHTAGKSVGTIRNWCVQHELGRRVGGGTWVVSRVALAMFLDDDDEKALRAYHAGDRTGELVTPYFERFGLSQSRTALSHVERAGI